MKLIINCSNLYVGGGVQVSLSFINELKKINKAHEYHIFLSKAIDKQLEKKLFPDNIYFYLIEKSPATLKTRKQIVAQLDTLEKQIKPDVVFSVFGPSYWKPKAKHVMGFANACVLQKNSVDYDEFSFLKRMKKWLRAEYGSYYVKRDATHYIIETEDGKSRLSNVLKLPKSNISVVGNSYSDIFEDEAYLNESHPGYIQLPKKEDDEFRLLLVSHNYPQKNLKIIGQVLPLLRNMNLKFVLTIDEKSYNSLFPTKPKQVLNLGPISQKACPSLYAQCDALFLPTLLEVFSASYPEAMKMEKPILTSNYSFTTDVCQDAALYFDPLDPKNIAKKIKYFIEHEALQKELIVKGKKRVKEFETARFRAEKYIELCENIRNK